MKQAAFFPKSSLAYGGNLYKTRLGRASPRPLATRSSMHLVLRSSKARGEYSFLRTTNKQIVKIIIDKFSRKYGVKILSFANVGNHLHLQIKLTNRHLYKPFIRAITAAIAMAIQGVSRWKKSSDKFWDYRPFTRVIKGFRSILALRDYIEINNMEGLGVPRIVTRFNIEFQKVKKLEVV